MSKLTLKEKFTRKFVPDYNGRCPICRGQGETKVLPFGDDSFFCENPICKCTRHSNGGFYELTEESIQAPNVTYVEPTMIIKRE